MKPITETVQQLWVAGLLAAVCLAGTNIPAQAADRALLVGVGKYRTAGADLPGIELDIDMMQKELAPLLGFQDSTIKILRDEEASLVNVERALSTWLVDGVNPADQVLFYFSGHGTRIPDENGDEEDGADEVLVMHDVEVTERGGRKTLTNVLVDDRFKELLDKIPSRNVLVLVDACHSGTITKTFQTAPSFLGQNEGYYKFFYYKGMPSATKGNFGVREAKDIDQYVAVSAAADNEQSIATKQGSLFTLGVREVIRETAQQNQDLTPTGLTERVAVFIETAMQSTRPPQPPFHPQLSGSPELLNKPLRVRSLAGGRGPQWQQVEDLVGRGSPMTLTLNQDSYGLGELLVITVEVPQGGYLNVINVGPDDNATVLFPNKYHDDNKVAAGPVKIPTEQMRFDLPAQEPKGPSLVAAFLTQEPINLYQSSLGERDTKGNLTAVFGSLSPKGMRSFGVRERPSSGGGPKPSERLSAGKVQTVVCDQRPCR
jgi:hypothetical protein